MARKLDAKPAPIPFGDLIGHMRTVNAAALIFTMNVRSLGSKLESGKIPADKMQLVGKMLLEEVETFTAVMWPEDTTPCHRCGEMRHPTDRPDGCRDPGCPAGG